MCLPSFKILGMKIVGLLAMLLIFSGVSWSFGEETSWKGKTVVG